MLHVASLFLTKQVLIPNLTCYMYIPFTYNYKQTKDLNRNYLQTQSSCGDEVFLNEFLKLI